MSAYQLIFQMSDITWHEIDSKCQNICGCNWIRLVADAAVDTDISRRCGCNFRYREVMTCFESDSERTDGNAKLTRCFYRRLKWSRWSSR